MTVRPSPPFRDFEVAAILREVAEAGSGKSQFRRPLKPQPREVFNRPFTAAEWAAPGVYVIVGSKVPHGGAASYTRNDDGTMGMLPLRYSVGDLLWVRETHCFSATGGYDAKDGYDAETGANSVWFRATEKGECDGPWRSSTQMPRWAPRLTLEVVGVKIERLQEISEDDARAEGAAWRAFEAGPLLGLPDGHQCGFAVQWESVYGPGSWSANPFVAAVTFRPHLINVDEFLRQREGER